MCEMEATLRVRPGEEPACAHQGPCYGPALVAPDPPGDRWGGVLTRGLAGERDSQEQAVQGMTHGDKGT